MAKRKLVQSFEARRDKFLQKHGLKDAYDALITSETPETVAEALNGLIDAMEKYVDSIPASRPNDKIRSGFFCVEIVVDAAKILAEKPNLCNENVQKIFWKAIRNGGFLQKSVNAYAQNRMDPFTLFNGFNDSLNTAFSGQIDNPQAIDPRMNQGLRDRHR